MNALKYTIIKIIPIFLVFIFMLFACTESPLDERWKNQSNASYFDIAEADYIGIKRIDAGASTWSNLYKYNLKDGEMISKKVGLLDNNGFPIDSSLVSIQVNNMVPVSENYIIYTGSFVNNANSTEPQYFNTVLLRLTDGAFFSLDIMPVNADLYTNRKYLPADDEGNRYFLGSDNGIYKISNPDAGEPVLESVLVNRQWEIVRFHVAPDGTIFFREYSTNTIKALSTSGIVVSTNIILYNFFNNSNGQIHAFSKYGLNKINITENGVDTSIVYDDLVIRESEYLYQSNGNYFFFEEGTKGSDYSVGLLFNEFDRSAFPVIFRDRENNVSKIIGIYENTVWTGSDVSGDASIKRFTPYNLDEFKVENFLLDADTLVFNTLNGVDTVIQPKTSNAAILEAEGEITIPDNIEVYDYNFLPDGIAITGIDLNKASNISAILRENGDFMILDETEISGAMEMLERVN